MLARQFLDSFVARLFHWLPCFFILFNTCLCSMRSVFSGRLKCQTVKYSFENGLPLLIVTKRLEYVANLKLIVRRIQKSDSCKYIT